MKLLNTLVALTLALCAAIAPAADADPPAVVGRLNYISGPVSFAPAEANEDWSAATLNRPVTTGDRLWTDADGRAEMHVGSLAIRMGAQTSLDVLSLDERTFQLRLAQGSANLRVRRLATDEVLEIATPNGAVVVRQPGSYRINVDPSGAATIVAVRGGGQAEVFNGNSSFVVHDNQQAAVSANRQDLFAAQPVDEFDRWAATRDQREDRVVSTRYVPEEMTGYEDLDQYGTWRTVPDYGAVWVPTAVPAGWAPYRTGHWVWVSPWGWTWVDNAPWGFAPFHYGRWIWHSNHWAWAPGRRVARPVYAPALVAFIGGSNWSISVGAGPAVGWVPLGWREPYRPWYRASPAYVRNVNVTHVTNVTNITNNVTNVRLVNRNAPSAVTVVSRENFVAARRADQAALRVDARALAAARVTQGAPVAIPARTSLAAAERGAQPPAAARTRETVAVNTPPAPAAIREAREDARNARVAGSDERPRVRVVNRGERVTLQQAAGAPAAPAAPATQGAPAPQARSAETPRAQPQPAPADRNGRGQDKAAPQPPASQQAERRAPAPPPEVSRRPTFDRDMRPNTVEDRREQRQQRAEEQQAREQQGRQRELQRQQQEEEQRAHQQRSQQLEQQRAQEQQARARDAQRQNEERQRAQQQREQQAAQQRQQQAEQQQAREQQVRQREAQQRDQQQAQQRQQQAAAQQAAREQQAQQRAQQQQAAAQQAQQRAQQQAAAQQAQQRAQQQQAQQAAREPARPKESQQRAENAREKGRERQRADEKG